jgi:hypothetical protein
MEKVPPKLASPRLLVHPPPPPPSPSLRHNSHTRPATARNHLSSNNWTCCLSSVAAKDIVRTPSLRRSSPPSCTLTPGNQCVLPSNLCTIPLIKRTFLRIFSSLHPSSTSINVIEVAASLRPSIYFRTLHIKLQPGPERFVTIEQRSRII